MSPQFFSELASRGEPGPPPCHASANLVGILRLLAVKLQNPLLWSRLDWLMDHREEREAEVEAWEREQRNLVGGNCVLNWAICMYCSGLLAGCSDCLHC